MPDCSIFIYYIYLTLEGPSASIDAIEDFNHCHSPSLCRKILKKLTFPLLAQATRNCRYAVPRQYAIACMRRVYLEGPRASIDAV